KALVVDPGRDIAVYLETAKREGAQIVGTFLTHSHADFVAGHIEMARATGSPIHVNESSGAGYAFKPVKDGSTLEVGEALIRFVETPGHTPDGLCAYVFGSGRGSSPEVVFTGDTLFVGSIGRPDLLGGQASAAHLAALMYDTWTQKLSKLGDGTLILPAHGAGSLCGAHLSDDPKSTIGKERASNPYIQYASKSEFIATVLDGLPDAPQYFGHNAAMNRKGPELVAWNGPLPEELPARGELTDNSKFYVVDMRDSFEYAAGHIPNSVNIGLRGRFESWVGIMVPWDANLVLCGSRDELKEGVHRLHRVGYRPKVLAFESWQKSGLGLTKGNLIGPRELHGLMRKGEAPVIVDVRLPSEWMGLRIGTVVNLPLNRLDELSSKLDPSEPVVTVCNSAYRSIMAAGILERKGFRKVSSLTGGSEAWITAGYPVYGSEVKKVAASSTRSGPRRDLKLPERLSPAELKRLITDLPESFDLIDIRPEAQFADFNLPGSRNVDIADAISDPAYLTGAGPLIIVDRDGSLAMTVAGIISQKTQRPVKALHGGLEAYWSSTELTPAVRVVPLPGAGISAQPNRPIGSENLGSPQPEAKPSGSPPPQGDPTTQPVKSKSAGC
ncbi:MAG: MBL fold metallo-hydrolase, partial [Acidobacteriota bacterium]